MLESHMKLYVTELDFPENILLPPKLGKMKKKQGFLSLSGH